jgi:uncharacterized phage infection (PIP) family protein YhgE
LAKKSEKPGAGKGDIQRIFDQLKQLEDENQRLQKEVEGRRSERARLIKDLRQEHKRAGERVKRLDTRLQAGQERLKQLQGLVARLRQLQNQKETLIEKLAMRFQQMQAPASTGTETEKHPAGPARAEGKDGPTRTPAGGKGSPGETRNRSSEATENTGEARIAGPSSRKGAAGPPGANSKPSGTVGKTDTRSAAEDPNQGRASKELPADPGVGDIRAQLGSLLEDVKNMKRTRLKLEKEIDRLKGD